MKEFLSFDKKSENSLLSENKYKNTALILLTELTYAWLLENKHILKIPLSLRGQQLCHKHFYALYHFFLNISLIIRHEVWLVNIYNGHVNITIEIHWRVVYKDQDVLSGHQ